MNREAKVVRSCARFARATSDWWVVRSASMDAERQLSKPGWTIRAPRHAVPGKLPSTSGSSRDTLPKNHVGNRRRFVLGLDHAHELTQAPKAKAVVKEQAEEKAGFVQVFSEKESVSWWPRQDSGEKNLRLIVPGDPDSSGASYLSYLCTAGSFRAVQNPSDGAIASQWPLKYCRQLSVNGKLAAEDTARMAPQDPRFGSSQEEYALLLQKQRERRSMALESMRSHVGYEKDKFEPTDDERLVYIEGLHSRVTRDFLYEELQACGKVRRIELHEDFGGARKDHGPEIEASRLHSAEQLHQIASVQFARVKDAERAIEQFQGRIWFGAKILMHIDVLGRRFAHECVKSELRKGEARLMKEAARKREEEEKQRRAREEERRRAAEKLEREQEALERKAQEEREAKQTSVWCVRMVWSVNHFELSSGSGSLTRRDREFLRRTDEAHPFLRMEVHGPVVLLTYRSASERSAAFDWLKAVVQHERMLHIRTIQEQDGIRMDTAKFNALNHVLETRLQESFDAAEKTKRNSQSDDINRQAVRDVTRNLTVDPVSFSFKTFRQELLKRLGQALRKEAERLLVTVSCDDEIETLSSESRLAVAMADAAKSAPVSANQEDWYQKLLQNDSRQKHRDHLPTYGRAGDSAALSGPNRNRVQRLKKFKRRRLTWTGDDSDSEEEDTDDEDESSTDDDAFLLYVDSKKNADDDMSDLHEEGDSESMAASKPSRSGQRRRRAGSESKLGSDELAWSAKSGGIDVLLDSPIDEQRVLQPVLPNASGSARSEPYRKVNPLEKAVWREQMQPSILGSEEVAEVVREAKRDARTQYRLFRRGMDGQGSDGFAALSALEFAKKSLRFDRSPIHGYGLFALERIEPDEFIIEYMGQKVRSAIARMREIKYTLCGSGDSYLFRLDANYVLDSTYYGTMARFVNHSCEPNVRARIMTMGEQTHICFYSLRRILPGEEILYDYKFEREMDPSKRDPCYCGAPKCRGFMN
ncbi:Histone-lysine N-methyltransferase, H3 lysine-4 specific [Porphyridium purpureum]|uniref:[histone H3]-lysine(4) N-trimethyltransferase n=1 Tax=Porphyridium purpureum TaxID=35688 RepID=A0A5J4YY19_PORPP|nr:Histone-lysine N-methyltransferase, H3 lysine-4 specific [Porphyridium purpureum]|eukprot:POR9577..scf209_3